MHLLNALILDGCALDAELAAARLRGLESALAVTHAANRRELEAALATAPAFDVIVSALSLPDLDGRDALALARARYPHAPFVVVSDSAEDTPEAQDLLRHGATDLVPKSGLDRLAPAVARALTARRTPARLDGIRVLMVDDSADNRRLVHRFISIAGGEVELAGNGAEAVAAAMARDFDVVLMDIQMPEMDGYEATRRLRAAGYARPILALTGEARRAEPEHCLAAGFDAHLTKPIHRLALCELVSKFSLPASRR